MSHSTDHESIEYAIMQISILAHKNYMLITIHKAMHSFDGDIRLTYFL